jgi:predicted dehydrogenase
VSRQVSLGVVGLGTIAQTQHLPNVAEMTDSFRVRAIADISPALVSAVADRLPGVVNQTQDWRDICADPAVEAVLLLTPGAHEVMAEEALLAGKHVLAEKPLCLTIAAAHRLDELARDRGLVLQVGYMKLHEEPLDKARNNFSLIGDHRMVRHAVYHPETEPQLEHTTVLSFKDANHEVIAAAMRFEEVRTVDALGAIPQEWGRLYRDVLHGSLIHSVSLVRGLMGALPTIENAQLWPLNGGWRSGAEPPSLTVAGMLGDTTYVELSWLWLPAYPEYREVLEVHGTGGSIELEFPPPYVRQQAAELTIRRDRETTHHRGGTESAFFRQLEAFHSAIAGGEILGDARGVADDIAWLQDLVRILAAEAGVRVAGEAGARQ